MKIAIASGKGGTGKTTVAVSLASMLAGQGESVWYVDCDVEEPNGHIFLRPQETAAKKVYALVPKVDSEKCNGCGACGRICRFGAIVCLDKTVMVFDQLCKSCGGCSLVCPTGAISETGKEIGEVEIGKADAEDKSLSCATGRLKVGDIHTTSVIKEVVSEAETTAEQQGGDAVFVLDCPPGTSCPVIESVRGCDFAVLVTEPTPFGLNDLQLAVEMIRKLGVEFGVFINRDDKSTDIINEYCAAEDIEILGRIEDDRSIAEAYSRGELINKIIDDYGDVLAEMYKRIVQKAAGVRMPER